MIIIINLNGELLLELQTDIASIGTGPHALTLAGARMTLFMNAIASLKR